MDPASRWGEHDVSTAVPLDDDVVAGEGPPFAAACPFHLGQRVGRPCELRPPGLVVRLAVVDLHHPTAGRREDGPAEREEPLGRLGGERRAPVADGRRAPALHRDEVDGVGRGEQVCPVARHPPCGTHLRAPRPPGGLSGSVTRPVRRAATPSTTASNRSERNRSKPCCPPAGRAASARSAPSTGDSIPPGAAAPRPASPDPRTVRPVRQAP